jgi:hypothetical protein
LSLGYFSTASPYRLLLYVGMKPVSQTCSGVHVPETDGPMSRLFFRAIAESFAILAMATPNSPK